jgi:nucleotide-binding universal stress UspA family protein
MQKKILIAVDGSYHATNGLLYAADLLARSSNIHCGLIHVHPPISQYYLEEADTDPVIAEALDRAMEKNRIESEEILEKSRQLLLSRGIDSSSIEMASQPRCLGRAKDIIDYAHRQVFDAIVTGRRGLSRVQKIFMGSTSAKLVEFSRGIPVWIVDGEITPRKFLVVVDVASPWQHLVDHLRHMCAGIDDIEVTFFYVRQGYSLEQIEGMQMDEIHGKVARKEQAIIDRFWDETTGRLKKSGMKERQFEFLTPIQDGKIGKMILSETEAKPYDTVVIGRRGREKSFFSGSVSRYVIERLTDRTLWISE